MLKENWRIVSASERVLDNFLIIAAFFFSYGSRDALVDFFELFSGPISSHSFVLGPIVDYFLVLGVALPVYNGLLFILGAYRSMRLRSIWSVFKICSLSALGVFVAVAAALFIFKLDLSRIFVGSFCVFSGLFLFLERLLGLYVLRFYRVRGKNFRNVLIAGTGEQARKIYFEISRENELGLRVVGFADLSGELQQGKLAIHDFVPRSVGKNGSAVFDLSARVVCGMDNFEAALKQNTVDEVIFTDLLHHYQAIEELSQIAVEEGIHVTFAADLFSLELQRSQVQYLRDIPLIQYHAAPANRTSLVLKRLIDIFLSVLLLVILSPFMLIAAIAIKLDSRGPVFFVQKRLGLNGRTFKLYKFRSMVCDAEEQLSQLLKLNEMQGPVFKVKNDPRITRVGRFLRRFSIDELPQLFNVLLGDMSLVGPRPPLPDEVRLYERKQRRRLSMRPGLTCIWQVSGRNEIPNFEDWAKLDLEYIDSWSLWTDFVLLVKTVPAVLRGSGAR